MIEPEIVTVEWTSTDDMKLRYFVIYDANPPRWWQFWRKRWLHTMRYGPIIKSGEFEQ